jgi:hypothetical protein
MGRRKPWAFSINQGQVKSGSESILNRLSKERTC